MSHEHDDGQLAAYLDGALSDVERARLEARLAREPGLADTLAAARATRERAAMLLDTLQLPAGRGAPPDLATLRARARTVGGGGGTARKMRLAPMAWAAALVGVIGVALALQRGAHDAPGTTAVVPTGNASAPVVAMVDSAAPSATGGMASPMIDVPAPAAAPAAARSAAALPEAGSTATPAAPTPVVAAAPPVTADLAPRAEAREALAAAPPAASVMAAPAPPPVVGMGADRGGDERGAAARGVTERAAAERGTAERASAERAAAERAMAAPSARVAPAPLSLDEATTILGATPWRLADARLLGIVRMPSDAVGGAVAMRELLAFRFRDASGRDVTLLQQRADGDVPDDSPAGWRTRDRLRVRLMGEFTPAVRDSIWARLRH